MGSFTNHDGLLSFDASGLSSGTAYYYTFRATNEVTNLWASPSMSFSAMSAPQVTTLAALDVTNVSATLSGQLASGGAGEATFYLGLTDGVGDPGAWEHAVAVGTVLEGAFSAPVSVLAGGTYYCRAYVTNALGADWADNTVSFVTPPAQVSLSVAAAGGVEPLDIPGCILWLDAGDVDGDGNPATDPPAGTTITRWTDLSGAGHDADGYAGNPSFVPTGPNGKSVIRFDGVGSDHLFTSHDFRHVAEYSVFLVARYTGGDSERVLSSKDMNWLFGFHQNGDQRFHANGWIVNSGTANTNWHVHAGTMSDDADPRAAFWKDGTLLAANHVGSHNTDYKPGRLSIGGYNAEEFSKCEVAEIIYYDRELSHQEVAKLGDYLARKYGLTATYAPDAFPERGGTAVITATLDTPAANDVTVDLSLVGSGAAGLLHKGYNIPPEALMDIHDNGGLMTAQPHGTALLLNGPGGRGLDFNNDADFVNTGVINVGDNYMNLFLGYFHVPETGDYQFRRAADDDRCGIWLDMDRNGVFEAPLGYRTGENISWEDGGAKSRYLQAGQTHLFAVTHGEYGSGSQVDIRFKMPSMATEVVIKPGDLDQLGLWTYTQSVPAYGNDYTSTPVSVVIPAGDLSAEVVLTAIDDAEQEEDEGITAAIDSVVNAVTGTPDRVATRLSSDDPQATNLDGVADTAASTATLNGVLAMGDGAWATVHWGDNDGGTNALDWDTAVAMGFTREDVPFSHALSGLLAGVTYYYRCYATNDSLLAEDWADETASFTMPTARASMEDIVVTEGDTGTVDVVFTVTLSAASPADAFVDYATANDSAVADGDYLATNGTLRIPAGQTSGQIVVKVMGDTEFENHPESFSLRLRNAVGCEIDTYQATGTIMDDDAGVHLAEWRYRMRIGFDGYTGGGTLTNWPALVRLGPAIADFAYASFASPTGGDLRFSDANEDILLSYEVETWDTNGESIVWVRVPELPSGGTHIWAYWGNADETAAPSYTIDGSTWSEGYRVVQHMADASGTAVADSSPDSRNATIVGSGAWGATGGIGRALQFTGNDNDRIELAAGQYVDLSGGEWSGSAWFQALNGNSHDTLFRANAGNNHQVIIWSGGNDLGSYDGQFRDSGGDLNRAVAGWHHITGVGIGAVTKLYVDGIHVGDSPTKSVSDIRSIGGHWGGGQEWSDYLDEARISDVARSADWIMASYSNQVPGSTFNSYAVEGRPIVRIVDGATGIDGSSANLTATLVATGTTATTVWAYWGESDGEQVPGAWDHGETFGIITQAVPIALSTNVTGLTDSTRYYYAYIASNAHAVSWASASFYTHGLPAIDNGDGAVPGPGYATLTGNLLSTGGSSTAVNTYWGESDGGTNTSAWDSAITNGVLAEGPFSSDTPPTLFVGRSYYYRCRAESTNGSVWADSTESFVTGDSRGEGYRLKIAFDGYAGNETLTNFPALVTLSEDISGFSYETFLSSEGHDLRFWDATRSRELNSEIERWNGFSAAHPEIGRSDVWVQVPELTAETVIRVTWGNPLYTAQPAYTTNGATWSDGYRAVWHMDAADPHDSSPNGKHGTGQGDNVVTDGLIGKAQLFDGNDWVQVMDSDQLTAYTLSAWVRTEDTGNRGIVTRTTAAISQHSHQIQTYGGVYRSRVHDGATRLNPGTTTPLPGTWQHVTGTAENGGLLRLYVNGVEEGTPVGVGTMWAGGDRWRLGSVDNSGVTYFLGAMDEVRISDAVRSADWIAASYLNQASNAAFNSYGAVLAESPVENTVASGVTTTSATLNATLHATNTSYDVWAYWGTTDEGANAALWADNAFVGAYTNMNVALSHAVPLGLQPGTTYYYTFRATNSLNDGWGEPSAEFRTYGVPAINNDAGAAVAVGYAALRGSLVSTGGAPTTVYTYWGETDGGTNAASWGHAVTNGILGVGAFSTDTPRTLIHGIPYYYRCSASNSHGTVWADSTAAFAIPLPEVSIADATAPEGDPGDSRLVTFDVELSHLSVSNVLVDYATQDRTAMAPADYTAVSNTMSIPAGSSNGQISVTIIGDLLDEAPFETLGLNLSGPVNATLVDAEAVGTITDDDLDESLSGFDYRMKITFAGYAGSETLTNFPALVRFGPGIPRFNYAQFADDRGYDLYFVDATKTVPLSFEIEHWDTNGNSYAWVQVPELKGDHTYVWAYWGNPSPATSNAAPDSVPGCVLWLDASDIDAVGNGMTGDPGHAEPVPLWRDRSPTGSDASQENATMIPTVRSGGPGGCPVVRFDGSDQLTTARNFDNLTEYSVLTVSRYTGGQNARVISSRTQNWLFGYHGNGDEKWHAGGWIHNAGTGNTDWHLHVGTMRRAATPLGSFWKDGTLLALDAGGAHVTNYKPGRISLGGWDTREFSQCEVAEVLIYNRALSSEEINRVGYYLSEKYALGLPYAPPAPYVGLPPQAMDGSTWSEGFVSVNHLSEGSGRTVFDSTPNRFDGWTANMLGTEWETAQVGKALHLDGLDDHYVLADLTSVFAQQRTTLSLLIKLDAATPAAAGQTGFVSLGTGANCHYPWTDGLAYMNVWRNNARIDQINLDPAVIRTQWHMVTITSDYAGGAGRWKMYQNAGEIRNEAATTLAVPAAPTIGRFGNGYVDGMMDEVRISNVVRSPDWIEATWRNQGPAHASFSTYSFEEMHPGMLIILR